MSVDFKGGWVMLLEEGRTSWDLDAPFRIAMPPPWLPPHCIGEVVRFWFAPGIHGSMKIYLSYEGCEL